MMTSAKPEA
jgi:hypothetical protein